MVRPIAICAALVMSLSLGCASRQAQAPRPPETKPWLDGRTLCALDLGDQAHAASVDQLRTALEGGVNHAFAFPTTRPHVTLDADRLSVARLLRVDITDAQLKPERRPPKLEFSKDAAPLLTAKQFEMVGEPLRLGSANVTLRVQASDAQFQQHAYKDDRRPALVLTEARRGTIHISIDKTEMERMLMESARKATSMVQVKDLKLDLNTDAAGHALQWHLYADTRVLLLPAKLHITGSARMDDQSMVTLDRMDCDGDDLLGPLMAKIIRPTLQKYEGRTRPLLSFGAESKVRLKEAKVTSGQRMAIDAVFGE